MEIRERSIIVTKTARYFQLGECGPETRQLWIVLHGYGQLASYFVKHFMPIVDGHTCVVAPEGLSRFYLDGKWERVGASWMTKEDRLHEIDDYIGYLDGVLASVVGELGGGPPEVVVLGFSQGTATAWRWMMKGQVRPRRLILWAGGVAGDTMERAAERLAGCAVDVVVGDADQYIRLADVEGQLAVLRGIKPDARLWTFAGDHRMDGETLVAMKNGEM